MHADVYILDLDKHRKSNGRDTVDSQGGNSVLWHVNKSGFKVKHFNRAHICLFWQNRPILEVNTGRRNVASWATVNKLEPKTGWLVIRNYGNMHEVYSFTTVKIFVFRVGKLFYSTENIYTVHSYTFFFFQHRHTENVTSDLRHSGQLVIFPLLCVLPQPQILVSTRWHQNHFGH